MIADMLIVIDLLSDGSRPVSGGKLLVCGRVILGGYQLNVQSTTNPRLMKHKSKSMCMFPRIQFSVESS